MNTNKTAAETVNTAVLRTCSLRLAYHQQTVLQDLDLGIGRGELVALLGPNGAGKSSLLKALAGLLTPAFGSIELQGQALSSYSPESLAKARAYLPQSASVHWPQPVRDVVALGRLPHGRHRLTEADEHAIVDAMHAAGVDALATRPVNELSAGEQARVMMARLFATGAQLLLADEPTAALDLHYQHQIMTLFRQHADNGGSAVVVLHDLNLAARYCDRLLLLNEGHVVADGNAASVLTAERLRAVYHIEASVIRHGNVTQVLVSPTREVLIKSKNE